MEGWGWNEIYLVQAFLAFNSAFEVLVGAQYMLQRHREVLMQAFPGFEAEEERSGASLWIRADVKPGYDTAIFERLAELEARSWWFRSRNRLLGEVVREHRADARRVLEIGTGTGYTLQALAAALPDAELVATELHEEGLAIARGRVPQASFVQLDALAMPYREEFDLVAAFDVLEHIDDDAGAVRGIAQALRPGGSLVLTVPQHRWLWSEADDWARHARRYTRREMLALLQRSGFEPRRVTSFVSLLLPLMAAARMRGIARRGKPFDPWAEFQLPRRLRSRARRDRAARASGNHARRLAPGRRLAARRRRANRLHARGRRRRARVPRS